MADLWLEGPVTSTAWGWRLERRDGLTIGFTSHDRDVEVDGLRYRASPGLVPTTISASAGLEDGALDVRGALSSDAIRSDDLRCGRWDSAMIEIFLFDWADPDAGRRQLASGWLGSVDFGAGGFSVEIHGPASRLSMPVAPFTSPACRARFCDAQCGLNAERFRHRATLASQSDGLIRLQSLPSGDLARFEHGQLRWLSGANTGIEHVIIGSVADGLILDRPPPEPVDPDATLELYEGCDKRFSTCVQRFANMLNFRGEPHVPGNDLLTRYPGL